MNPRVRSLFHELADLTPGDRERFFADHGIEPDIRAQVESLLRFDSTNDHGLIAGVSDAAKDALQSSHSGELTHCGPYRRIRLVGTGGMGSVYLAERTDGELQQKVAVKLLRSDIERPAWRDRFLKERQFLSDLNHPSIAHLIDAGHTTDGRPYLVMEYVDGVPIDVYAAELDLNSQLALFLRVCDGVSHAHSHLIIHRDLKPSNILVDASGQPKLLDFGIARLVDETADRTRTVERLLTPNYASPEQLRGTQETTASDVYSLGAVLYKIVTGQSPHESQSGTADVMDVIAGARDITPPRRLRPNLPIDVDYILRKALRSEPSERYSSVEALANEVRAFLDCRPIEARSSDAWYRTRKLLRRYRTPVTAALLILIGLSVALYEVNRARATAERRFQQVRALSNKVLALDDVIGNLPNTTKAREEIVAMSKEYLEGLEAESHFEPDLALEVGTAYASLAQAQGVPTRPNLGLYADAEKSLIKAESLMEVVLRVSPENRAAILQSAQINQHLMILADSDRRTNEALAHARKAVERIESLLALRTASQSERDSAAVFMSNIALAHKNLHFYEDSIRYARRTIDMTARPGTIGNSLSIIADCLRFSGDLDGALSAIREARIQAERADYPSQRTRVTTHFNVLWREGVILGEDGQISLERPDEAIVSLQKAFDMIEDLAKADADDVSSRILFASGGRELGNILLHRDPERALAVYDQALSRLGEVKNNTRARRGEAQLMAASSYALRRLNRVNDANRRIDAAFKLLGETKDYPADRISPGSETETVLRALGDHLADTGQPQRAAGAYQELLDKMMASNPDAARDLRHATAVSRIYESLARLHVTNGQSGPAQALSGLRLELWKSWAHKIPQNLFIQRQLEAAGISH